MSEYTCWLTVFDGFSKLQEKVPADSVESAAAKYVEEYERYEHRQYVGEGLSTETVRVRDEEGVLYEVEVSGEYAPPVYYASSVTLLVSSEAREKDNA